MSAAIVDTHYSSGAPTGATYEASFPVASGECLLLSVGYGYEWGTPNAITSVVLDPSGMNQALSLVEHVAHDVNARRHSVYVLNAVAGSGTLPLRVTFDGSSNDQCRLLLRRLSGHDVSDAVRASTSTFGGLGNTSPTISSTVASATGDFVLDFLYHRDEVTYVAPASGQTDVVKYAPSSGNVHASSAKAGAASVTMGWESTDPMASYDASHIVVSIAPASAGSLPSGTVTIGTITKTHNSASVPWTYDAADETGYEYSLDSGPWTDAGTSPLALSSLTPSTAYSIRIRPINADGAGTPSTAADFTTDAAPGDTTAPTLTSPTGTATGSTTASGSVSTDEGNGTLYAVCTTSSTAPSAAQVQAGTDDSGVAAAYATSQSVSGTGEQAVAATGLTAEGTYYWHFQHKDAAGNDSAVVSSAGFTTDAANAAPTFDGPDIGAQSGTEGVALTPLDVSSRFSDTDALTFSAIGTWPTGVTVSSAGVIDGTPTTAGTYSGLQVRATDTAAQTVDSDSFAFTIAAATGTITTEPLKNNTGTVLASETGATVHVYETTGALVVTKTGQTTDASGIMTITDALIVPATEYRIVIVLASGAEGMDRITAA